jgi:hypothetical protein
MFVVAALFAFTVAAVLAEEKRVFLEVNKPITNTFGWQRIDNADVRRKNSFFFFFFFFF